MLPDALNHGETTDLTVTVTDRGGPEGTVQVATEGMAARLLVPDESPGGSLEDGRYRLTNVVPVDPEVIEAVEEWLRWTDPVCPDCGGALSIDRYVDDEDRDLLDGADRPLLVPTASTTVDAMAPSPSSVDDWRMHPNAAGLHGEGLPIWSEDVSTPLVCDDCGLELAPSEYDQDSLDIDEPVDPPGGGTMAAAPTGAGTPGADTAVAERAMASQDLGMATGGAKDATNFRDNVAEGYVPHPDALSHEGLFYDYYFDTGEGAADGDSLFYPTYSAAVSDHPLEAATERYLTVGLNSTLSAAEFERKRLNLVAVLDVSGSMSSPFSEYYYDEHGRRRETDADEVSKMHAAREALAALTTHLADDDRFGIVLFNSAAHVAKPLRDVESTDMDAIRGHIREVKAGGGTDMSAGFRAGRRMLEDYDEDPTEVENRVVFLTDAMPNLGELDEGGLVNLVEDAAVDGIHTTFVGMGIDANADLIDALSAVRGANHYFVHSAEEFERRLDDEFEYMVTPLVFDLSLDVVADGYELAGVYGSPDADAATGEVMHVSTLFPSPTEEGETRGGVVLLELERTGTDPDLELVASWTERDGESHRDAVTVEFPADESGHFENAGVRKAVLLARYADLLRDWAAAVRASELDPEPADPDEPPVDDWQHPAERERSEWEQESVPLRVPAEYADLFERFRAHLVDEMGAIGDDDLVREVEVIDELLEAA